MWKRKLSQDCEKLNTLHYSVACRATSAAITWTNHLLYCFITVTLLWRDFGSFVFTALPWFINICGHSCIALKVTPQHFNQFEVWTLSHCCTFWGLFCCCMTQFSLKLWDRLALHFILEYFGVQVNGWANNGKVPVSCGWKTNPNHHPSSNCMLVWGFCCDILCLLFSKCGAVYYSQTSRLCKAYCSRGLVVCLDAAVKAWAMLQTLF